MKRHLLMISLGLLVGAAVGYWNGEGAAQRQLADICARSGVTVVYDRGSHVHRYFHCFELDTEAPPEPPVQRAIGEGQLVL